jgi:predicted metal-dependent hydrolase
LTRTPPPDARQLLLFDGPAAAPVGAAPAPHAGRRLFVGHEPIYYTLRRARRRSIGFTIDDRGLTVAAPRWIGLADIEAAIVEKQRWIRRKLVEWRDWRASQPATVVDLADGGMFALLGRNVTLRLRTDVPRAQLHHAATVDELHLPLPADASRQRVRDAVQAWLKGEARRVIGERIALLAPRSRVQLRAWSLSSARSQWGACTHDRRIRINWRLVHFSLPVIDYVVAHELAHLEVMNHSPRFWQAVGELLPGFETARDQVRQLDLASLPL